MQCPSCHGAGGEVEPILDDGTGPWYDCCFCNGKGELTRKKFYKVLGYLSSIKRRSHVRQQRTIHIPIPYSKRIGQNR
jgi:hypothetical protein